MTQPQPATYANTQGFATLIGPGVTNLQDYTQYIDYPSMSINAQQGAQLDQFQCTLSDLTSGNIVGPEDDLVVVDMSDPNGFPTVNLLLNPSFEGTFVSGLAPSWSKAGVSTGVTFAASGTALYGAESQSIAISNASVGNIFLQQLGTAAPEDENENTIYAFPYTFSAYLRVTAGFTNCTAQLVLSFLNAAGSTLLNAMQSFPINATTAFTRYSVSSLAPAATSTINVSVELTTSNATNSGTLLVDAAQLEYQTLYNTNISPTNTAHSFGCYPTNFTDPLATTTFLDSITANYYRQLRLFGGFIRDIKDSYAQSNERARDIVAVDYGVVLQEAPATLVITAQPDNTAISQAFTYARNQSAMYLQGIDYTTHVANIANVDAFAVNWNHTRDVLDHVSNQTVASYWVDYNKFLWYQPSLAVSAPYGFSSNPDMHSTYPFSNFTYETDSSQSLSEKVVEGSTQLSAGITQTFSGNGSNKIFTLNSGNPVDQIDSLTVGGTGQTIGLQNVNTFAQGYTVLLTPQTGVLTFNTAPPNVANNVVAIFRYASPVILRVHNPAAEGKTGSLRRKIHSYTKYDFIASQQSAIDRANAELNQYSKGRPIGNITAYSPPCPTGVAIRPGQAIAITHVPAQLSGQLFQVQSVKTTFLGFGGLKRDIVLGFYRPDFMLSVAQIRHQQNHLKTNTSAGTVLNDVQSVDDGWAVSDATNAVNASGAVYGGPGTWGTTYVWS